MEITDQNNQPVNNSQPNTSPGTSSETVESQPVRTNTSQNAALLAKFNLLPLRLKAVIIAAIILIVSVLFLLILSPRKQAPPLLQVSPSPIIQASFSPIPQVTSEFSKTEEFRNFESNLNTLQNDLNTIDLDETNLVYPLLDMQVNYGGR